MFSARLSSCPELASLAHISGGNQKKLERRCDMYTQSGWTIEQVNLLKAAQIAWKEGKTPDMHKLTLQTRPESKWKRQKAENQRKAQKAQNK